MPQGVWYVYVVPDGLGYGYPFAMAEVSRTDKLSLSAGFSVTLRPPPVLDRGLAGTLVGWPAWVTPS